MGYTCTIISEEQKQTNKKQKQNKTKTKQKTNKIYGISWGPWNNNLRIQLFESNTHGAKVTHMYQVSMVHTLAE